MKKLYIILFTSICTIANATEFYVKHDATGMNDGSSWTNAFTTIQAALTAAGNGDKIYVAAGVYKPHASDRTVSFDIKEGEQVYGGFDGTEIAIDQTVLANRNFVANETILSGDILGDDSNSSNISENSYNVITIYASSSSITSATVVDGFTIVGGNADGTFSAREDIGGGVMIKANFLVSCSPTLSNLIIKNNFGKSGAGMSIQASSTGAMANPTITDVQFINNTATGQTTATGGGVLVQGVIGIANPAFENITFEGNKTDATSGRGGALTVWGETASSNMAEGIASPSFTNVKFCNNTANIEGGAIYIRTGAFGSTDVGTTNATFTNVTISGNNSPEAVFYSFNNGDASPVFKNCIIYSSGSEPSFDMNNSSPTPTVLYSLIEGSGGSSSWQASFGTDGGNNIDTIPNFVDESNCDLRLLSNSLAIGTGNITDGNNMGYYQGTGVVNVTTVLSTTVSDSVNTSPIPVTITFSENVSGFDLSDLNITNGSGSNFVAVDSQTYTVDITPTVEGIVSVTVPAGKATATSLETNLASNVLNVTHDTTAPAFLITTLENSPTNNTPLVFTLHWTELVGGGNMINPETNFNIVNATFVSVSNCSASTQSGYSSKCDYTLAPITDGIVSIQLKDSIFYDFAGNIADTSNTVSVDYQSFTTSVELNARETIEFYPNPSSDKLWVKVSSKVKIESFLLTDAIGRQYKFDITDGVIELSGISTGFFILEIKTDKETILKKLLKN